MGGLARAGARPSAPALPCDHAAGGAHRDPAHSRLPGAACEGDRRRLDHRFRRADACRATDDQCHVPADDRLSDRCWTLLLTMLAALALGAASGKAIARRERDGETRMIPKSMSSTPIGDGNRFSE